MNVPIGTGTPKLADLLYYLAKALVCGAQLIVPAKRSVSYFLENENFLRVRKMPKFYIQIYTCMYL